MAELNKFEMLRSLSLPALVQEELLRMIKAGQLVAGQRVNELDLAERLGVSRPPVREALRSLEAAGLVCLERNRGMFVRRVSDADAAELYQVRAALAAEVGRLLAPRITDDELRELGRMLDELEACGEHDVNRTFPLNIAFHDRLAEMTGNTIDALSAGDQPDAPAAAPQLLQRQCRISPGAPRDGCCACQP